MNDHVRTALRKLALVLGEQLDASLVVRWPGWLRPLVGERLQVV